MTPMTWKHLVLLPVLASLALLAAGCGSSKKPQTTADWAGQFCSAVSTWKTSVSSTVSSLKGGNLSKDSITNAFDQFKSATKTFESNIKKLGKPPTKSGDQVKQSIDTMSSQIDGSVKNIQNAVSSASAGAGGILNAISVASAEFTKVRGELQSTLTSVQQADASGELKSAFQQSPNCKGLTGSSS